MEKKWYESKTLWFAILFGIVNVAGVFGFAGYEPSADVQEISNIVVAAVFLVLRLVTNKKIVL